MKTKRPPALLLLLVGLGSVFLVVNVFLVSISVNPTVDKHLESSRTVKYIEYGAQSGWSNQLVCLEHAIWIARSLNRVLILSPILPHHGHGSVDHATFRKKSLSDVYSDQTTYVPLESVLDFQFIDIKAVDYRAIHHQYPALSQKLIRHSHRNTKWILNQPQLEEQTIHVKAKEYGREKEYTQHYRDITKELARLDSIDVLTFPAVYRESFFHSSMAGDDRVTFVYSKTIRQIARTIAQRFQEFISIHIRGGDGVFRHGLQKKNVISIVLERAQALMVAFQQTRPDLRRYTLHIATDLKDIESRSDFKDAMLRLNEVVKMQIEIVTSKSYETESKKLTEELKIDATLFLDQQIASCATIGFTGTENIPGMMNSTFTAMIRRLREVKACFL